MKSQDLKKYRLPDKSGVYFWKRGEKILYIGKATSLRDRVKSYLGKDLINTRGPAILDMVTQADKVEWQETDSVLEALILEANLIKKHQPKYNTKEKDNKSFNYVCITKDEIPKVLIIRGRNLEKGKYQNIFGPFPNGSLLREAMKNIRPIFPYLDNDSLKKNNKEFYKQLGLIPQNLGRSLLAKNERGESLTNFKDYKNNIKNLKLFFQGKKKNVISNLKKEMMMYAKKKDFEKAEEIKRRIFALNHINDVALIKNDVGFISDNVSQNRLSLPNSDSSQNSARAHTYDFSKHITNFTYNRIEAYDIAHMSGKNMVGVMTVIEDGEVKKDEYKKFLIKTQSEAPARAGGNDTGALEEVLSRRLRHTEWGLPNIIVVDGGKAQINVAKKVLNNLKINIASQENPFQKVLGRGGREPGPDHFEKYFLDTLSNITIVSVLKDEKHKAKAIIGDEKIIEKYQKEILLANSESHRFAIAFHKQKRNKNFLK